MLSCSVSCTAEKQDTVTHFLIVTGVMPLACFVLKWFEPWSTAFWIMLAVVAIGYFIVWLIMYQCYKKQVRKLDELLKESQEAKENVELGI